MGPGEFLIWLGLAERVARRRRNKKFLPKEKMLFFPKKIISQKYFPTCIVKFLCPPKITDAIKTEPEPEKVA